MITKKKCEHTSFEKNGIYWKCQNCSVDFSNEEVERIMIRRRQGFDLELEK
ncbi:MAG: hypothetical protein AABY22_21750 [Nanoarchaeota archaeon]